MYHNWVDIMCFLGADAERKNARDGVPVISLSCRNTRPS